jgi:hypothetical protein
MRKGLLLFLLGWAAATPFVSGAQVVSSAVGGEPHLWVGAEYSNFRPDWGTTRLPGIGLYVDLNARKRYGLEGEARFLDFTKPSGLTEKNFLGGAFFTVYSRNRFSGNVKFLIGANTVNYTDNLGYGSYFAYVPGGNIEYRLSHKWKARFDYEAQFMPSAPGDVIVGPGNSHGLTPSGFSGGVAYHIF